MSAVAGGPDDPCQSSQLRGTVGVADHGAGGFVQPLYEEGKNLLADERQQQSDDNLWNAMLYKVEQIQVPAVFEGDERMLLLWK